MNAVFTIVAKNYLPLAFVQAETLKKFHPDIHYSILVCDSPEGLDMASIPYEVKTLDVLNVPDIEQLEFKYNLTEFCTAVKPYYFNYLFNNGAAKAIYLDPDVCVFSSLQPIFDELDNASIVVTPHFITPEIEYTGTITEALLLHVGVFNFGFAAVAATERGRHFINWWQNRLHNLAYQDKIEALHTDQKWADLVPAFYGKEVLISDDIGRNMAFWNLHERRLVSAGEGVYEVQNRFTGAKVPLMLFHFAGYDIKNADTVVHKHHPEYSMDEFPELRGLFTWYRDSLLANKFKEYITLVYKFNKFDNGAPVSVFQRRLYRRLIEEGKNFGSPFGVGEGSFYGILKKNNLLSKESVDGLKNKDVDQFKGKISKLNFIAKKLKNLLGFDRYSLLLKFCMRYFRPENQTFLIEEFKDEYTFLNENKKYHKAEIK